MSSQSPDSEATQANGAVFLSYAREDTAAAQRVADALRSQGVEVWFDQSELRGGDVWDKAIRKQIKECVLFVPIISVRTQARGEGYFRLEWKLAVERTHLMAEGVPFLAPVVVDDTPEGAAVVPAEFLRVQWIRLPGALPTPQFVAQVKRMLGMPGQGHALPSRSSSAPFPRSSGNGKWAILGITVVMVAILATIVLLRRPQPATAGQAAPVVQAAVQPEKTADAVDPKSVAVLPFENMSEDKDNAFFTDGVHEDVLTNLSFVKDLRVVSRTSVMQYRNTTKPIKEIGRELGVAYVLEGSVRRSGNKVRVTGQLIDARTDEHVWAKAYDRDLNDIFAIQGELAQSIAAALQSVLSPETKEILSRRPTENAQAYDDYVKARQLLRDNFIGTRTDAEELLDEAVRLDPNFAAAWAAIGSRKAFLHFGGNETKELMDAAKKAIDTAVRLAPDDPSVLEGLGDYYYYAFRDYARATEQYMRLAQLKPNDPVVSFSLGLIQRRQGRLADSLVNLRHAANLDPTNQQYASSLVETLFCVRRYDEGLALVRAQIAKHPDRMYLRFQLAMRVFMQNGSTDEAKAFARSSFSAADQPLFLYMRQALAGLTGDWDEFARLNKEQRYFDGSTQDAHWNEDSNSAECFAEMGDMVAARARATETRQELKDVLSTQPENEVAWSDLAMIEALLGHKDEAIAAAQKTMAILPETRDAIVAPGNATTCAYAYAWMGDKDRAVAEFERLLHVPFGVNIYALRASPGPLRDDPRLKKMVADLSNNDPLF